MAASAPDLPAAASLRVRVTSRRRRVPIGQAVLLLFVTMETAKRPEEATDRGAFKQCEGTTAATVRAVVDGTGIILPFFRL